LKKILCVSYKGLNLTVTYKVGEAGKYTWTRDVIFLILKVGYGWEMGMCEHFRGGK